MIVGVNGGGKTTTIGKFRCNYDWMCFHVQTNWQDIRISKSDLCTEAKLMCFIREVSEQVQQGGCEGAHGGR